MSQTTISSDQANVRYTCSNVHVNKSILGGHSLSGLATDIDGPYNTDRPSSTDGKTLSPTLCHCYRVDKDVADENGNMVELIILNTPLTTLDPNKEYTFKVFTLRDGASETDTGAYAVEEKTGRIRVVEDTCTDAGHLDETNKLSIGVVPMGIPWGSAWLSSENDKRVIFEIPSADSKLYRKISARRFQALSYYCKKSPINDVSNHYAELAERMRSGKTAEPIIFGTQVDSERYWMSIFEPVSD
jgi:hypothetical protein